jgi:hypothetical protein
MQWPMLAPKVDFVDPSGCGNGELTCLDRMAVLSIGNDEQPLPGLVQGVDTRRDSTQPR